MVNELPSRLKPHERDLRIVLKSGIDSRAATRGLDPVLASSNQGPYDRTVWLDGIAKNLQKNGSVYLWKECERRNWLIVVTEVGNYRFLPFLGSVDARGRYSIHNKGPMTKNMEGVQTSLFDEVPTDEPDFFPSDLVPDVIHGYALRTISESLTGEEVFELHLFWGDKPVRSGAQTAYIKHYGTPLIIRMEEGGELAPVYIPDFDPQGVA